MAGLGVFLGVGPNYSVGVSSTPIRIGPTLGRMQGIIRAPEITTCMASRQAARGYFGKVATVVGRIGSRISVGAGLVLEAAALVELKEVLDKCKEKN